jgi:NADH:ubiquinone oxidoreductase subunit 3 (subunit A)
MMMILLLLLVVVVVVVIKTTTIVIQQGLTNTRQKEHKREKRTQRSLWMFLLHD